MQWPTIWDAESTGTTPPGHRLVFTPLASPAQGALVAIGLLVETPGLLLLAALEVLLLGFGEGNPLLLLYLSGGALDPVHVGLHGGLGEKLGIHLVHVLEIVLQTAGPTGE